MGLGLALICPGVAQAQEQPPVAEEPPAAPAPDGRAHEELAPEEPEPAPEPVPQAAPAPRAVWTEAPEPSKSDIPAEAPAAFGPIRPWTLFAAITHTSFGGSDFNGGGLLFLPAASNQIDTTLVPAFGSGTGFLLGVGFGIMPGRVGRAGAFVDVTYGATWLSPHSVLAEGSLGQSIFHQINVPLRLVYRPSRFVAPYMEASIGGGWVNVQRVHGYVDLSGDKFVVDGAESHFGGMTMGIGLGSYFIVQEYLALDAYVGYGTFILTSLKDIPLEKEMTAPNWQFRLGPTFFL